jgi:hypothetical protein
LLRAGGQASDIAEVDDQVSMTRPQFLAGNGAGWKIS